jgi:methylamine dehydrogenase accessory protein MauD
MPDMTSGLFWISYAAAWVLLVALSASTLILFRVSVRAYRMHAPQDVGDVGTMNGPSLDASPPLLELEDLTGEPVSVGRPRGAAAQLIVFAKNTCPKCKIALELLRSFTSEHAPLQTIVVCGGDHAAIRDCASQVRSPLTAVADVQWEGAKAWQVSRMPFGVVLDADGFVRARGDPTSAAVLTALSRHLENSRDVTLQGASETETGSPAYDGDFRGVRK